MSPCSGLTSNLLSPAEVCVDNTQRIYMRGRARNKIIIIYSIFFGGGASDGRMYMAIGFVRRQAVRRDRFYPSTSHATNFDR